MKAISFISLLLLALCLKAQDAEFAPGEITVKKAAKEEYAMVMREVPKRRRNIIGCSGCIIDFCRVKKMPVPAILLGVAKDHDTHAQLGFTIKNDFYTYRAGIFYQWSFGQAWHSMQLFYQKTLFGKEKNDHGHMILALGLQSGIGTGAGARSGIHVQPYLAFSTPACRLNSLQLNIGYQWNKMFRDEINEPKNAVRISLWFYL